MKKYFLFFLLALLPVVASAYDVCVDGIYYNLSGDEATVTYIRYDFNNGYYEPGYSGNVVLPASITYDGKTYSVTRIGSSAFADCINLKSVTIPESVKSIDEHAFESCSLTAITIPSSVTSIGSGAFVNCSKLASITIPENVKTVGSHAFYLCSRLATVTILGGITYIDESTFSSCTSLTTVNLPGSITRIGTQAFQDCTKLASITIPESATIIGTGAFQGCSSLTSVSLPKKLMVINDEVFCGCKALTSFTIPEGVLQIRYQAFADCTSLTSVVIPSSVTGIVTYAFRNCSSLADVYCYAASAPVKPQNSTTTPDSGYDVFKDTPIASATLHVPVASLTSYRSTSPWNEFGSIVTVDAPPSDNIYFDDANTKAICIANWDTDGDGELSEAEAACVTDLGEVFRGNTTITSFNELWYFSGLTSIGDNSFSGCSSLISVIIPDSVTSIGSAAFQNCNSLTPIRIPDRVTSIGSAAFSGCSGLTSVTIPNNVTSIGSAAFQNCSGLTSIKISDSVTSIGSAAFQNCSSLTSVKIPNGVTSIGSAAFQNCRGMTSVNIPNGVKRIDSDIFRGCSGLTTVIIPKSVEGIGAQAFADCSSLKTVEILGNVTAIASRAFQNCGSLTKVYCDAVNVPETGYDAFDSSPISFATLYVPTGSEDLYKATSPWNEFGRYIIMKVRINEENFPDTNFREFLLYQAYGKDGILTAEEISDITVISSLKSVIESLKGIEYFTALKELDCSSTNLTELDMTGCSELEKLDCHSSKLTSLNVSNNKLLKSLNISYNRNMPVLDVSQNTQLASLNCDLSNLQELYLPKGPSLTSLRCFSARVKKLDVSGCTSLSSLNCSSNKMTSLDVSGCTAMTSLDCSNNKIVELKMTNTPLTSLQCASNNLTTIDLSSNTALNSITCEKNQLTALDVSKNTALTTLNCSNNKLAALDVSKNTALTTLNCSNNKLAALDVSQNTALTTLQCGDNQLAALDVSRNTGLKKLECYNNQLPRLDVSECTELQELNCYLNQIKEAAMDMLVEDLPTTSAGNMYVISQKEDWPTEQNVMTTIQVAAANAKGWQTYSYVYAWDYDDLSRYTWKNYSGSKPTDAITYTEGQMATIILPTMPDASKGKYYRLDRCEDGLIVFEQELQPQAHIPYVIVPDEDFSIDLSTLDLAGCTCDTVSIKGVSFIGSYVSKVLENQEGFYIDIIDSTPDCLKAEIISGKSVVGALRAYLQVNWEDPISQDGTRAPQNPREKMEIILLDDGDGIGATLNDKGKIRNDAWYDLLGRRQSAPQRGLNIIRMSDGSTRKVMMK